MSFSQRQANISIASAKVLKVLSNIINKKKNGRKSEAETTCSQTNSFFSRSSIPTRHAMAFCLHRIGLAQQCIHESLPEDVIKFSLFPFISCHKPSDRRAVTKENRRGQTFARLCVRSWTRAHHYLTNLQPARHMFNQSGCLPVRFVI